MRRLLGMSLALVLFVAGCGGGGGKDKSSDKQTTTTVEESTTTVPETTTTTGPQPTHASLPDGSFILDGNYADAPFRELPDGGCESDTAKQGTPVTITDGANAPIVEVTLQEGQVTTDNTCNHAFVVKLPKKDSYNFEFNHDKDPVNYTYQEIEEGDPPFSIQVNNT